MDGIQKRRSLRFMLKLILWKYEVQIYAEFLNLIQEMVSVIDQDGDGDISFNEFVWLMTK